MALAVGVISACTSLFSFGAMRSTVFGSKFTFQPLGPEHHPVGGQDLGLLLEDEHHRPPRRDHCEWLIGGIEDECSGHGPTAASIAVDLGIPAGAVAPSPLPSGGILP